MSTTDIELDELLGTANPAPAQTPTGNGAATARRPAPPCNRLALDIETAGDPEAARLLPPPDVKTGNLKDPAKIQEKIAEAIREQGQRLALDPHFGRVIAVGLAWHDAQNGTMSEIRMLGRGRGPDNDCLSDAPRVLLYPNEADLLRGLWATLAEEDAYATFNGALFDLPYLYRRSMLLGVDPLTIDCGKYSVIRTRETQHLDVMQCLHVWDGGPNNNPLGYRKDQHFYARTLLGRTPPHTDIDKSRMADLLAAEPAKVADIVQWDAETTLLLADLCHAIYP